MQRMSFVVRLPGAAGDVRSLQEVGGRYGDGPHAPAPVFTGRCGCIRRVRHVTILDQVPGLASVDANLKAIMAAFCAPLPAPLPMVALVVVIKRIEEARLHFYDRSASRGDEGKSQRQFAC